MWLRILSFALLLGLAIYTLSVDKKQGRNPIWSLLVLGLPLVVPYAIILVPFYFLFRSQPIQFSPRARFSKKPKMCPKCGHENPAASLTCDSCHNQLSLE